MASAAPTADAIDPGCSDPVVVFDGGELTCAEVDDWLDFRPLPLRRSEAVYQQRLQGLVLLEVLEKRFATTIGSDDSAYRAWLGVLERRLLGERLDKDVRKQVRPTDAEVARAYEAEPDRYDHPRLWRLQNLWKTYTDDEEREAVLEQVTALRRRIAAGDLSFEQAARQESESTTASRGGNLGMASLDRLHPRVAEAVAKLEPGEMTPPIDTGEGIALMRCLKIVPSRELSTEEASERHRQRLWREQLDARRSALETEWLRDHGPSERRAPAADAAPDTVVLRWPDGTVATSRDLDFFARDQGLTGGDPDALLDLFALSYARSREARRRGLDDEVYGDRLSWENRLLQAELALEPVIEAAVEPPSRERITEAYERLGNRLITQEVVETEALVLSIRPDEIAKEVYDRFRDLPRRLREGLSFAEATEELAPWVVYERWGRESERSVFRRGRDVELGIDALEKDDVSDVLQEGRNLFIVRLLDREQSRPLTFEEATPRLVSAIVAADRERVRARTRGQILVEIEPRIVRENGETELLFAAPGDDRGDDRDGDPDDEGNE